MLSFAKRECVGRPFSNAGMARSILWPRQTDRSSFFCAELVASILREGGLLESGSNPGSATPEALFRLYKGRAAATANPHVLRDKSTTSSLTFASVGRTLEHSEIQQSQRGPFRVVTGRASAPVGRVDPAKVQITLNSLNMSRPTDR